MINPIGRKLNDEDNNLLLSPFTKDEFKKAVFQVHPDKAPGPVAKTLTNRLQRVLSKWISEKQSGFVSGRSILDNVLVALEIIQHLKYNTGGKGRSNSED